MRTRTLCIANTNRFVQIGSSLDRKIEWLKSMKQDGFLVLAKRWPDDLGIWVSGNIRPLPGAAPYVEIMSGSAEVRNYPNTKVNPDKFEVYELTL